MVDTHEAVTIGDLEEISVALLVVEPRFNNEDCQKQRSAKKGWKD